MRALAGTPCTAWAGAFLGENVETNQQLPLYAIVPGRGKCRVLAYTGNGYFDVLDSRDHTIHIHRDRLTFTNQ